MRRTLRITLLGAAAFATLAIGATDAPACGDKFLVLGRGVRNRIPKSAHPSSIVLYVRPGSQVAEAARALKLQPSLAQAGHRLQEVRSADDLAAAMRGGAELVLVDLAGMGVVADQVQGMAPNTRVLPLVDRKREDVKAAQARFAHAILVPSLPHAYLKVIDSALQTRQASR